MVALSLPADNLASADFSSVLAMNLLCELGTTACSGLSILRRNQILNIM